MKLKSTAGKPILILACCSLILAGCEVLYPLHSRNSRTPVKLTAPKETEATIALSIQDGQKTSHAGEAEYIKMRRKAAKADPSAPTLGVAFSGGGIRSATISLGALQGLEDAGILKNVDYLSCVSGGGYIGSWYVSHLKSEKEKQAMCAQYGLAPDDVNQKFKSSRSDLLEILEHEDHENEFRPLKYVRDHGSISGPGAEGVAKRISFVGKVIATMVPNLVQDLGVHLQPSPGKWNLLRPFYGYRQFLEDYYLTGWEGSRGYPHAVLSRDVNQPGSETPFFISCAALANSKGPLIGEGPRDVDGIHSDKWNNHHFEMTSLWCGSPLIGWCPTRYFDRPISDVKESGSYKEAEVLKGALPEPLPWSKTNPFRLSSAVAISGAAVDSRGFGKKYRITLNTLLTAINWNLRYQTANFNQNYTALPLRPLDRLRETTTDRFIRGPQSNSLQISDGGHYENLGVYALLRRGVPKILAFDAGMDGGYKYNDLKILLGLCRDACWKVTSDSPSAYDLNAIPNDREHSILPPHFQNLKTPPSNPVWHFQVVNNHGAVCQVYYIKTSFVKSGEGLSYNNPLAQQNPCLYALNTEQKGEVESAKEVDRKDYPHIFTFTLWGWNKSRFDAYRDLGRLMGRTLSAKFKSENSVK